MRKLIITRGLPGSGKSHTLDQLGLTDFTIAPDALRLIVSSPVMGRNGKIGINQENNGRVWSMLFEIVEKRMSLGETIVVDATHPGISDFKKYIELSDKYRYDFLCLDFSEVPEDVSMWGNEGRPEHRIIPEFTIQRIQEIIKANIIPEEINRVIVRRDRSHLQKVRDFLDIKIHDLGKYKKVIHIGDLQGTYDVFMRFLDQYSNGKINDDTFYVFVGDFCDRGIENGKIMRWAIDNLIGRDNVAIIQGNHEKHLLLEGLGQPHVSAEFDKNTLPQLIEAGVTREELLKFYNQLVDMFMYRYNDQYVMVTHGGLPTVPAHPWQVPSYQCIKGIGYYEENVDKMFSNNAPVGWFQVHGHRNSSMLDIQAYHNSFNLEESVEFGGYLRCVVHDKEGFETIRMKNNIFAPYRERLHQRRQITPPWINESASSILMPQDIHLAMTEHEGVRIKSSEAFPNVVSYSFTRKVFYDKSFDDVTVKARGLFANKNTMEIVARAYDKFFNIGEREDTTIEALKERLVFPLNLWNKENGFLGNIGYDSETDRLFISSKSTPDGEFAEMFREIFAASFPSEVEQEALKRRLRDWEASMAFEVIDPIRDPHIVEYENQKIVLLDVIHRSIEFQKMNYADLKEVGKKLNLETKTRKLTFNDWRSFEGWYNAVMRDPRKSIEGYVIEDANNFQVKIKTPWYSFWKLCRGYKDNLVSRRNSGKPIMGMNAQFLESRGLSMMVEQANSFTSWCNDQNDDTLRLPIIQVRKIFEEDMKNSLVSDINSPAVGG